VKRKAIYPGSFDPITLGHIDIIERASRMFDEVYVGVLVNVNKNPLFSIDERLDMIKESVAHLPNVKVVSFGGLLVDFAKQNDINFIIRGLRAVTDFEYELQLAQTNHVLNKEVDTIFLTSKAEYAYISSSAVREIAHFGGDYSKLVTKNVAKKIKTKVKELNKK